VFANEYHAPFRRAYQHARESMGYELPEYGCSECSITDFAVDPQKSRMLSSLVTAARADGSLTGFMGGPQYSDFQGNGK